MSFPFSTWPSDRGVLAPIPLRPATWPCPSLFCNNLPWPPGPWLFPTPTWTAMELLQTCPSPTVSTYPTQPVLPPTAPPTSIFPPPFLFRPPFPCHCCPPPGLKAFSAPTNVDAGLCPVSGNAIGSMESKSSPSSSNREFRCSHCFKSYNTAAAFHMHLRTHVQGCQCPICGKSFSRHWLLQGHIRTHTGEKPFSCPRCGKAFADKSNLRAHVQTHSGLKPFACGRCGKAFALKSYLSKHEESACVKQID